MPIERILLVYLDGENFFVDNISVFHFFVKLIKILNVRTINILLPIYENRSIKNAVKYLDYVNCYIYGDKKKKKKTQPFFNLLQTSWN